MYSFWGPLPFGFLQLCSLEFHTVFQFHSWREEPIVLPVVACVDMSPKCTSGLGNTVVRICLSIWADQACVTVCLYHAPWYATPNSWQQRDSISRSRKALLAAALSQMMLYTRGSIIPFLITFLKKTYRTVMNSGCPETISTLYKMLIWFSISLR